MCGEYSAYLGLVLFQVEQGSPGHPFMKMCNDPLILQSMETYKTFNDLTGGIPEHHRFRIIPLTGDGIHMVQLPEFPEYFIFPVKKGSEIHQESYRSSF